MNNIINKNELIKILEDWNFWQKNLNIGIKRPMYVNKLQKSLPSEQVKIITGARRSGKSFIMRQVAQGLIENGVDKKNILMVNFEDPRLPTLSTALLEKIFTVYQEILSPTGSLYLFFDEIQEVPEWEKWVRTAQELKKANIVISGSNAKLLSHELSTVLTGRHTDMTVLPLSFREFLHFKNVSIHTPLEVITKDIAIKRYLQEFIEFGSFPMVTLEANKESTLLSYFDDVIHKDLVRRYKIRKSDKLKSLIKFYLSNISSPVTLSSSGKFLNISTGTVERFSHYLETSYLIFFLTKFSFKVKEQEKSPKKVYAVDTGLANIVGFRSSSNSGRLAENIVFLELKRRALSNAKMEIFYWKNERQEEIDFVVKKETKVTELLQVCWNIDEIGTKKRELRSLVKGLTQFDLNDGLVITDDYEGEEMVDAKKIQYMPLRKWLLGV